MIITLENVLKFYATGYVYYIVCTLTEFVTFFLKYWMGWDFIPSPTKT